MSNEVRKIMITTPPKTAKTTPPPKAKPQSGLEKLLYGQAPSLDPKTILKELKKDETIQRVKRGEISLFNDNLGPKVNQDKAVALIQRGLITLGLMTVDTTKKHWWRKPIFWDNVDGGIAWGSYGDRTIASVKQLQDLAKIDPKDGLEGQKFGSKTLKALETALNAKAAGKDWKAAVKKAADQNAFQ